jgi:hypothetical protein
MARRLDQDSFAGELKAAVGLAFKRYQARTPGKLEQIFGQERKLDRLNPRATRSAR